MRMMMQMTIPVEAGNEAARTGAFGRSFQKIIESLRPEAAYFGAGPSGERGAFIVFDLKDTSQIPAIAEPFFLAFNARVTFFPVMNAEDLAKAGPGIEKAVAENLIALCGMCHEKAHLQRQDAKPVSRTH